MGPNGAGKSTLSGAIMGKPGYEVLAGSVTLDGDDVLAMPVWERAAAGLHLVHAVPDRGARRRPRRRDDGGARRPRPGGRRRRRPARRRSGADRAADGAAPPVAQRRPVRRREEAQRDAAARRAAAADRRSSTSSTPVSTSTPCGPAPSASRRSPSSDDGDARTRRAGDHPLQPPAHRAASGQRAHPRQGPHRRLGRPGAGRRAGGRRLRRVQPRCRARRRRRTRRPSAPSTTCSAADADARERPEVRGTRVRTLRGHD